MTLGDLVVNFGAICEIVGYDGPNFILQVINCKKDGQPQGGVGQKISAPAKNVRLVTASDGITLTCFDIHYPPLANL